MSDAVTTKGTCVTLSHTQIDSFFADCCLASVHRCPVSCGLVDLPWEQWGWSEFVASSPPGSCRGREHDDRLNLCHGGAAALVRGRGAADPSPLGRPRRAFEPRAQVPSLHICTAYKPSPYKRASTPGWHSTTGTMDYPLLNRWAPVPYFPSGVVASGRTRKGSSVSAVNGSGGRYIPRML